MTDDYDDNTEDENDDLEDESEDSDDAASGGAGSENSVAAKRVRDLQSKADKETARANKAEAELAKLRAGSAKVDGKGDDVPESVKEWLSTAETRLRESLFEEDPRFKEYELDPELITGDTPAQLRESQKALRSFVDKLEGTIRNKVLVEHGFSPEPKSSSRSKPVNYATMTSEEFAKIEKEALSGGMLRRS